jgi:hypothetical protein
VGGNVGAAAKAAATGALEAAGSLGQTAVKSICDVLVGTVAGLKDVACAIMPKSQPEAGAPPAAKPASEAVAEKKAPKG